MCGWQLPARVAQRISVSGSLSAQSLGPSSPAAFISSAKCFSGLGMGLFFFSGLLDAGWIFPVWGGFSGAFAGSQTSPEGRGGCSLGTAVDSLARRCVYGGVPTGCVVFKCLFNLEIFAGAGVGCLTPPHNTDS